MGFFFLSKIIRPSPHYQTVTAPIGIRIVQEGRQRSFWQRLATDRPTYPPRRSASQKARQRIQEGRHAVFVDVIHQLTADRDQEGRQRFSFDRLAVADLQT